MCKLNTVGECGAKTTILKNLSIDMEIAVCDSIKVTK
jgi:hypothetical protein